MLALSPSQVQAIDMGVLIACAAIGGSILLWAVARGCLRKPIGEDPPALPHATLFDAFFAFGLMFLAAMLCFGLIALRVPTTAASQPGSHAWHMFFFQDYAGKLAAAAYCVWALRRGAYPRASGGERRCRGATGLALLTWIVVTPAAIGLAFLLETLWNWYGSGTKPALHVALQALRDSEWGSAGQAQIAVSAIVVAAVTEELLFRGVLLSALKSLVGAWGAILLSAVAFGLVHWSVPISIAPMVLIGVALGWLRFRTGSMWACILVHLLFNLRTMTLAILAPELMEGY